MSETCSIKIELPDDLAASRGQPGSPAHGLPDHHHPEPGMRQQVESPAAGHAGRRLEGPLRVDLVGDRASAARNSRPPPGQTKEEALAQLRQMTRLHEMDGCP